MPQYQGRRGFLSISLQVAGSIEAVTLGLDLTLRGLQSKLKADGHPWEVKLKLSIFEMVK